MTGELTGLERRQLKAQAHHLRPIVQLGHAGATPTLLGEIDRALRFHELIKIRLSGTKAEKLAILDDLTSKLEAALVGLVGHVAILYRVEPDEGEGSGRGSVGS